MANGRKNRDVFVNRYRGRITSGAAGAAAFETFNTGMNLGQRDPTKWVIVSFSVHPSTFANTPIAVATDASWLFQLAVGAQTAILNADDMQVIAQMQRDAVILAGSAGASSWDWPLRAFLPGPIPVFCNQMTVGLTFTNDAAINSKEYGYEIGYFTAPVDEGEIGEYLAAFGAV